VGVVGVWFLWRSLFGAGWQLGLHFLTGRELVVNFLGLSGREDIDWPDVVALDALIVLGLPGGRPMGLSWETIARPSYALFKKSHR
jgi:hypothetical protein